MKIQKKFSSIYWILLLLAALFLGPLLVQKDRGAKPSSLQIDPHARLLDAPASKSSR
ncbi:MAG: hypothetical protein HY078_00855 [Elusimicrobia bacterium]|nr:hypothetical protein [Elusimicrobiota bacterium]